MTTQFWVGLACGWAGGLLFGRFVLRTVFDQLIRGTRMVTWLKRNAVAGVRWVRGHTVAGARWVRGHSDPRGVAVVIMALATGTSLIIALHADARSERADERSSHAVAALHALVACTRDYNKAQSKAATARAAANAPTQKALRDFLHALRPLLAARAKGSQPTPAQLLAVRFTYLVYDNAAATLNRTLKETPLPPSPDTFCEGIG